MRQASGAANISPHGLSSATATQTAPRVAWARSCPVMALSAFRELQRLWMMRFWSSIIAQQGIFHFRKFGADAYVVDMVGILVLREIGVLIVPSWGWTVLSSAP
jgi:ABC-type transporter Mla maintaining outer membrane lipid asymmetry permease subunit MlaE